MFPWEVQQLSLLVVSVATGGLAGTGVALLVNEAIIRIRKAFS